MILFLAFRNLFRNIRRTIAIILTIALGAGALFLFDGFICGVLDQYRDSTIHAHYGHGQITTLGYRDTVYEKPSNHWILNSKEIERFLREQEVVEYVFPRVSFSALLKKGDNTFNGLGHGIDGNEEHHFFNSLNIEEGKDLTDEEDGIILGNGLAKALNVKPGETITLHIHSTTGVVSKRDFEVTGIFHTGNLEFDSKVFRIQLERAKSLLKTNKIEHISVGLYDHTLWETFAEEFNKEFPDLEITPFNELDKVYYQHSVDWLNAQFHVVQVIILSIVLLGIFNTISASILERKQEIGNLRANGESKRDIMKLIFSEGAYLGLIGSFVGIALAYSIGMYILDHGIKMPPGPGLTRQFWIVFKFEWPMVVFTFLLSIISSLIASTLAGIKVARMPIAKALRSR